jgi:sulfotransferase
MTQFHFIAGLPRSGSTLLSAILRQNPQIHASMSSPVGGIFNAVHKTISGANEAAMFLTDAQREAMLRGIFNDVYRDTRSSYPIDTEGNGGGYLDREPIVFDTNRMWPSKLPTLVRLFPDCKIICCVRQTAWIVDSIERLIRTNAFQTSGIFGFEPGGTVYSRAQGLMAPGGLVGFALDALRDGYYSPAATGRMILVEYEALAKNPAAVLDGLYDHLKIPRFAHDFARIEQIPGAAEFDRKLGTPGLHAVRGAVEWRDRAPVLPPELFRSFPAPFWRASPNPAIKVIHCAAPEPQVEKPASDAEIERMLEAAQSLLGDETNV